ncbi:MAG: hypothetical protein PVJ28_08040 [Acidimicrobiia bacterium]|jgi:hypothetical protein
MGQADWADLDNALAEADLQRGVTAGVTPPPGAGNFVYGYNSVSNEVIGAHGKYVDLADFNPTGSGPSVADGGGSVRGCVKRVGSPGNTGMTPMLFFCCQDNPPSVNSVAYILGLSDADPYEITLVKGIISSGIVADDENVTILRSSSAQYSMGDDLWHHLRLDAIVQPNGDVLLQVFANNLTTNPLGSTPSWQPIAGMADYIDDAKRINTNSEPLLGGFVGWAFAVSNSLNRRGAFKAIQAYRVT